MKASILYVPGFVSDPDEAFRVLSTELDWEKRDAPRQEYYCNDINKTYIYGNGKGRRSYDPRPWHEVILKIRRALELRTSTVYEVCFLNRYLNQSDQLGWHSDDSPEMDDARFIAVVSLGVEREIWFRPKPLATSLPVRTTETKFSSDVEKLKLQHGSLCLMDAGMQDTWQHRIPKASFLCGERISLTFRGYVDNGVTNALE